MTLVKRNANPRHNYSKLMNDFFNWDPTFPSMQRAHSTFTPAVNIEEDEKGFHLELAAPGFEKEDIKVELEENRLTISSDKKLKDEAEKDGKWFRKEFSYNQFSRTFILPKTVEQSKIEGRYSNGVLYVTIPKAEVQNPAITQVKIS